MKKLILMLLVALFVLPATIVKSQEKKPPPNVVEKKVVIKANEDWINTGIKLKPKDKVFIKASGEVCFSNEENSSCVNPDGWDVETYEEAWPDNWNFCNDPIQNVNHAALIGNVGSDDFLIGKETKFFGKDGVLYIGINDCTFTGDYYNTGEFEVNIKVERPK